MSSAPNTEALSECRLCPRTCGVNRSSGKIGYCGVDSKIYVTRAALHFWEEPCISGYPDDYSEAKHLVRGSGTVFFPAVICIAAFVKITKYQTDLWERLLQ